MDTRHIQKLESTELGTDGKLSMKGTKEYRMTLGFLGAISGQGAEKALGEKLVKLWIH